MKRQMQEMGRPPIETDGQTIREWDRRPDESPEAFLAFSIYRDCGPGRNIRAAWRIHAPESKTLAGSWFNWSAKFEWKNRAAVFDQYMQRKRLDHQREIVESESFRMAENQRVFRDNEVYLAEQAFRRAKEILAFPIIRDSYIQQLDGKTIVHKATLITPSYYFAAAALMKAASDLGRRGLNILNDDAEGVTPDAFRRLFYKHTGEAAKDFPAGALPAPMEDSAVKPEIHLPAEGDARNAPATSAGGEGKGEPGAVASPSVAPDGVNRFKPERARP